MQDDEVHVRLFRQKMDEAKTGSKRTQNVNGRIESVFSGNRKCSVTLLNKVLENKPRGQEEWHRRKTQPEYY